MLVVGTVVITGVVVRHNNMQMHASLASFGMVVWLSKDSIDGARIRMVAAAAGTSY